MRISVRFPLILAAILTFGLNLTIPAAALAAGAAAKPGTAAKPDVQQKRVWTNDDVERLNPAFDANAPRSNSAASAVPAAPVQAALPVPFRVASSAPLDPQKDPAWYGQQLAQLEDELATVDSREEQLRQFRAMSAGLPTGLVLNAPCEGITTDNLIAELEARRQEIAGEIDDLADTARRNGMPPGILVEGRGMVQPESQPTVEEEQSSVVEQAREASDGLTQIQETVADMQDRQAARRMTLLQPTPGNGGNMTTDLLDRLDSRANSLQSEISAAEDAARVLGVPPGDLR
jgi:hypothetical protein